ncbi:hypothetical protein Tco_1350323, partial [Tanacetum coccineum]
IELLVLAIVDVPWMFIPEPSLLKKHHAEHFRKLKMTLNVINA